MFIIHFGGKILNANKKIKRKSYFVTEAIKIIEKEGIGNLTARHVADAAGFNPASIYNYFDNMDHLENTASIYFTADYATELTDATEACTSGIEIYITMWEIFLKHAFESPYIYYNVFYSAIAHNSTYNLFKEYYEMFPEQYPTQGGYIRGMLNIDKTQNRGRFVLAKCVEENAINEENVAYINDIHIGYTKSIITDIVKSNLYEPTPSLYHKILCYIINSMIHFVDESYHPYLMERYDFHQQSKSTKTFLV